MHAALTGGGGGVEAAAAAGAIAANAAATRRHFLSSIHGVFTVSLVAITSKCLNYKYPGGSLAGRTTLPRNGVTFRTPLSNGRLLPVLCVSSDNVAV